MFSRISRQIFSVNTDCRLPFNGIMSSGYCKENSSRPFRVSIEGNIGSGKTTLLNYFKQFSNVQTYGEPLDKWRNVDGYNLLGLLYEDMAKWSATFQSYVQLTRMQIQSSTPNEGVKVQMFERSVQNNRYCFLENSYRNGLVLPAQYAVLCKWYEWIEENVDISLDLIVYLQSSPEVVYERVLSRNRAEEKTVNLKYLESLHESHEKWLANAKSSTPVLIVDANASLNDIVKSYRKILPAIYQSKNNTTDRLK
ncbi:UNVERIFIED_CONTAM: hypothetical protein PYX00_002523 [Menopon gallinae]|uniref:Deoxynucleoside kinase domain-containing protein n=2 Tax=Menopon gallinae TaxID=328185 RepID=A0AAW2IHD4_9NEOP